MGAFEFITKLFKKPPKNILGTGFGFLDPKYNNVGYNVELNADYMTACRIHGTHASKFRPQVYFNGGVNNNRKKLNYLLTVKPNPFMEAGEFYEKIATDYYKNSNAIIYIKRNYLLPESIEGLYVIDPFGAEEKIINNKSYYKFLVNGSEVYASDGDVIHLARNIGDYLDNFGKRDTSIASIVGLIETNYKGMAKTIRESGLIRYLITGGTMLPEKTKLERAKNFAKNFQDLDGENGSVSYIDNTESFTQIDTSKGKYANASLMSILEDKIYMYLNTNRKILSADYNENEFQAYYETAIEPLAIKLANLMTDKLLTQGERDYGNVIRIDTNRLQTASLTTRINLANTLLKSPLVRQNDINDLLYIPRIEGGDEPKEWLNYYTNKNKDNKDEPTDEEEKGGDE